MRTQVVVPYNPITAEQYAKKLGISRKRFLELKAITDRVLAENAHKYQGGSFTVSAISNYGGPRSAAIAIAAAPHPEESHDNKRDASPRAAKRKPKD